MDVAHGPSFIYEPPTRILISSASGGTVPCSAHGIPPPSLSWLDSMEQPVSVIPGKFGVIYALSGPQTSVSTMD